VGIEKLCSVIQCGDESSRKRFFPAFMNWAI